MLSEAVYRYLYRQSIFLTRKSGIKNNRRTELLITSVRCCSKKSGPTCIDPARSYILHETPRALITGRYCRAFAVSPSRQIDAQCMLEIYTVQFPNKPRATRFVLIELTVAISCETKNTPPINIHCDDKTSSSFVDGGRAREKTTVYLSLLRFAHFPINYCVISHSLVPSRSLDCPYYMALGFVYTGSWPVCVRVRDSTLRTREIKDGN